MDFQKVLATGRYYLNRSREKRLSGDTVPEIGIRNSNNRFAQSRHTLH